MLRASPVALCIHDLIDDHPLVRTMNWAYMRFHGPAATKRKYSGRYGRTRLSAPAQQVAAWLDAGSDAYVYFNNDFGGHAVSDAITFRRLVAEQSTTA